MKNKLIALGLNLLIWGGLFFAVFRFFGFFQSYIELGSQDDLIDASIWVVVIVYIIVIMIKGK